MTIFLILAYLFFIGSVFGWFLELFYRKLFSANNPERKWINPGFCVGPYVPLYGCGLCMLYLIALFDSDDMISMSAPLRKLVLFIIMAIAMTLVELAAGELCLHAFKVRLWDYSNEWANYNGLICPKFSVYWALLGSFYFFDIHPFILDALKWLANNLAFSFVIGFFFGVFVIDVVYSANILAKMKRFADENQIVVRIEEVKQHLSRVRERERIKAKFLFTFATDKPLIEHLKDVDFDVRR